MAQINLYDQSSFDHTANESVASESGPRKQWRSLDELDNPEEFAIFLEQNPRQAALINQNKLDRRTFLRLSGAALVMMGITSCNTNNRPPNGLILPYVEKPEFVVPGVPLYFASTVTLSGYGRGILLQTNDGRPSQVSGNPNHPASLGSSDAMTIASLLQLYDPDRSLNVSNQDGITSWEAFESALDDALDPSTNLRILTETVTSPSLANQLETLLDAFPNARWHQYEPMAYDGATVGAELAFGEPVNTVYQFDEAKTILALDSDFLSELPGSVRYARDFAAGRKVRVGDDAADMSRLFVVESTPTITGAMADERLPLRSSEIEAFAQALAQAVGVSGVEGGSGSWDAAWLNTVVAELEANEGAGIVIAGATQSPTVHALAHAINDALGNVGSTVVYTEPVPANPVNQLADLGELVADMAAGSVDVLVMIGGNPVYTAPADYAFGDALAAVPLSAHLSQVVNETSLVSTWRLPQTHYAEEWGDARAYDGTASLVQPPIGPLYDTVRSAHQLLAILQGDDRTDYELVYSYWQEQLGGGESDAAWRKALHDGVIEGSAAAEVTPALQSLSDLPTAAVNDGIELVVRPDPSVWDGRFAGNSWLQELPRPMSKLTWDNVALMGPALAENLGVTNGDLIELTAGGNTVTAPTWILPGHADNSVTVTIGYGQTAGSAPGLNVGFDAYPLRTSEAPWIASGLQVSPTGLRYALASTQLTHVMSASEDPVQTITLEQFLNAPEYASEREYEDVVSFYSDEFQYDGYSWGMSIDLTACIGCNGCMIACQSENTVPTVGKDEVMRGRDMHWIRIDQYYEGDPANPQIYFQPVACVHCEQAPCEVVCPVQATVHGNEGLNEMVYNRCVGTRYCSANCPYGVRRFNFFDYVDDDPIWMEMRNPDVTVRARGVMEKCTYCVQRISRARIEAGNQNLPIPDGAIVPACAGACPTQAIVFGDINNPDSQVVEEKKQPQDYSLLKKLNTLPRTTYLARITNPVEGEAPS